MTKEESWHNGDKVKVIDQKSPHFGRMGIIVEIIDLPINMLNKKTLPTVTVITVKFDDTGEYAKFRGDVFPLSEQLAKIK